MSILVLKSVVSKKGARMKEKAMSQGPKSLVNEIGVGEP